MSKIYSTESAEGTAKAFLYDLVRAAGYDVSHFQRSKSYGSYISGVVAKELCKEVVERVFTDVDILIARAGNSGFYPYFAGNNPTTQRRGSFKRWKPAQVAKALAYMSELLGLYWDDTNKSTYEIDEFKRTFLGEAVYKYGRAISVAKVAKSSTPAKSTATAPKSGYKQSGPQSSNVRDLVGAPGVKIFVGSPYIYKIIGDNASTKNIPNAFIKPLSPAGVEAGRGTNKVFFSSGNGYTDCSCCFRDPQEAQKFMDELLNTLILPSNISNVHIAKYTRDKNGYYEVGTAFGDCLINARKLNEALEENLEAPSDWERATLNYSNEELEELHVWMRKD